MSDKTLVSSTAPRNKKNLLPAEIDAQLRLRDRRAFLSKGAAVAGTVFASGAVGVSAARAQALPVPQTNQTMGKPIPGNEYGMPSKFEKHVARRRTDVFVNRQNWSDWSMTPLQHQPGIVTPNPDEPEPRRMEG